GEVRGLLWDDIQDDMIVVPKDRMKAGKEHRVPITPQMREHLDSLPRFKGCDLLFPSNRMGQISDMTMKAAMRRCGLGQYTPHGWRSSFSDWANREGYRREYVEDALAHVVGNAVERAYRRGDFLEHRQELMADWADYLFSTYSA
ncbi:site-specific integrase, partial [Roseibium sp.]